MAIPNKATGAGNNDTAQVFKTTFSEALSTAPKIEAWDNAETFPARTTEGVAILHEIFVGTTENGSKPMMAAWSGGTTEAHNDPGAAWHPASPTGGSANPNLLKGTTSYVTCTNVPGAAGNTVFNLSLRVPYDATVPSTTEMAAIIQVRYTYTGNAPAVAFYYNEGTEGTPDWVVFTPGTHGIRFCNAGTVEGTYKLTLPGSGQVYAGELWITV